MQPIAIVHSPFKQRFTIPRQPGLVPAVRATVQPLPPYDCPEAWRGIEGFSHLWLIFRFHATEAAGWQPTVRPPRLGGNRRLGVFATRSNFRPNPLGLSVVALERVLYHRQRISLLIKGADLLDQTPVLDIKPYIPYTDAQPRAMALIAPGPPAAPFAVHLTPAVEQTVRAHEAQIPELREVLTTLLAFDPRPAYASGQPDDPEATLATRLYDFDLRWRIDGNRVWVLAFEPVSPT